LELWAKRIKIDVDINKIDDPLINFPIMVKLGDSVGLTNKDVTDVFNTLTTSGTFLEDDCSGSFDTNWSDESYGGGDASFSSSSLRIYTSGGSGQDAGNALTLGYWPTRDNYVLEFDWTPASSSSWYDDDFTDAQNLISLVTRLPQYNHAAWVYSMCERGVGTNTRLELHLRKTSITVRQYVNGALTTVFNHTATFNATNNIKWSIDFNNSVMDIYLNESKVADAVSWDAGDVVNEIGSDFKFNFHWHSYNKSNSQIYDNIKLTGVKDNRRRIAITSDNGTTQLYTEIENWNIVDKNAVLWTKVPLISGSVGNILYLYYDKDKSDNTDYVGNTGSTPAKNVWDSDFVAVYHMNQDPSGGSGCMLDATSNAHNGTPYGSMTSSDLVDGVPGSALDFDGSDDRIILPRDVTDAIHSNPYTIIYCGKVRSTGGTNYWGNPLLSQPNNSSHGEQLFYVNTDYKLRYRRQSNAGSDTSFTANTSVGQNLWFSGALVATGATLYIYTNGVVDGSVSSTSYWSTPSEVPAIGRIYIPSYSQYAGYCDGYIALVTISKVVRSSAWIEVTHHSSRDSLLSFGSETSTPVFKYTGYVYKANNPVARVVNLYRRSNGELVDSTTSDSNTGYFELLSSYNEYHYSIILPEESEPYNLIASDKIKPES
jgi:hypothetical protein